MSDLNKQGIIKIGRLLFQDALCRNWYLVHIDDMEKYTERPKSTLKESGTDVFETIKVFQRLVQEKLCEETKNSTPQDFLKDEMKAFASLAEEIAQPFYEMICEEFACNDPKHFGFRMVETIYMEGKGGSSPLYSGHFIKDGKEKTVVFQ